MVIDFNLITKTLYFLSLIKSVILLIDKQKIKIEFIIYM